MMPGEWNAILAPSVGWKEAYAAVEREARAHLQLSVLGEDTVGTTELVEQLYPEQFARGEGITARKRLFKALAALTTHGLSDCCTRGPERPLKHSKKMVRGWLWHAPKEREIKAWTPGVTIEIGERFRLPDGQVVECVV